MCDCFKKKELLPRSSYVAKIFSIRMVVLLVPVTLALIFMPDYKLLGDGPITEQRQERWSKKIKNPSQ